MELLTIITVLIVLAAIFGFINIKFLKLPSTIGLLVISIFFTAGFLIVGSFNEKISEFSHNFVTGIDFKTILLDVMLSFLLFAGALHINMDKLKKQSGPIIIFSTVGVVLSTFIVGTIFYYMLMLIGLPIDYIYTLLFGAIISPTDPIAVMGILKEAKAPKSLEIKIVGESLFNDGVALVVFITIFGIAKTGIGEATVSHIAILFAKEVIGGIVLGVIIGYLVYLMLKSIDHYETEIIITLAMVMGIYWLAHTLHFSGPLAVVVGGLFIGNKARESALSNETERYLDKFWEIIDVILNAVLFVLIGLELIILTLNGKYIIAGIIAIPIVLLARYAVLSLPIKFFKKRLDLVPKTSLLMTWGGLRGGISIALALSLTQNMQHDLILTVTYIVVIFSIVVQGLTLKPMIKKFIK